MNEILMNSTMLVIHNKASLTLWTCLTMIRQLFGFEGGFAAAIWALSSGATMLSLHHTGQVRQGLWEGSSKLALYARMLGSSSLWSVYFCKIRVGNYLKVKILPPKDALPTYGTYI